jgi:hypothetical protein
MKKSYITFVFTFTVLLLSSATTDIRVDLLKKNPHKKKLNLKLVKNSDIFLSKLSLIESKDPYFLKVGKDLPDEKGFFSNYKLNVDKDTQQNYLTAYNRVESNSHYQTNSLDYHNQQMQMDGYKNKILNDFVQKQLIDQNLKQVTQNSEQIRTLSNQVAAVTGKASIESGPVNSQDYLQLKMGSQANLWGRSGKAWMKSSLMNVEANVSLRDSELYKVAATREIDLGNGVPKLNSNFTYGGTSGNITAGVSSQLLNHVNCGFQSNFPKDSHQEHTVSISYNIGI